MIGPKNTPGGIVRIVPFGVPATADAGPRQMAAEAGGSSDFWSVRRLYEQARRPKQGTTLRLTWDSPFKAPRIGDGT